MLLFSSRRRYTIFSRDWSSDVCSSDLPAASYSADHLVDRSVCVAPPAAGWTGKWDGARPFDNANPYAHRGPTREIGRASSRERWLQSEWAGWINTEDIIICYM